MSKVLVTGGVGFIGSHLVEKLVKLGHDVTVVDRLSTGNIKNIEPVLPKVNFIEGDISDPGLLEKSVRKSEFIFHVAAQSSVNRSLEDPFWSAEQNIMATIGLLKIAAKKKVRRVIFSSSAAVYGFCKKLPVKESYPLNPASPYALEKVVGENYMRLFSQLYGLDTVSLRYFNVFGPRQSADLPHPGGVTIVINQIRQNGSSQLLGDGKQTRDMIYVENIVNANVMAMERKSPLKGAVYNIATGESIVISDLHEKISRMMGIDSVREYLPLPEG
ncbi:NAD-dependent epimerase/dehydratase family protein, partial [bacterium]|nr:NAD-dependent epimerase/dehydratase family protein [bacterium]